MKFGTTLFVMIAFIAAGCSSVEGQCASTCNTGIQQTPFSMDCLIGAIGAAANYQCSPEDNVRMCRLKKLAVGALYYQTCPGGGFVMVDACGNAVQSSVPARVRVAATVSAVGQKLRPRNWNVRRSCY